jgi:mono/diheme cytochrome c family protein
LKRWIRNSAIALGALVVLAGGAIVAGDELADSKRMRRIDVAVQPVALKSDAASVERGRYLYASRGCADCHGANGGGRTFVDDGKGFVVAGPNITGGPGGVVAAYRAVDWVRTIRHGVKPDGRPALVMPSQDYNRLTDTDVEAIVAYVRQLPPVAGGGAVIDFPLPVRVLYGFGAIPDAAARIDHRLPPSRPVPEGVTVEHGRYVANMCLGCHGATLDGGKIAGAPPDWPAASKLTPGEGDAMVRYPDAASFAAMFKSGKRPDGSAIRVMPFEALREMNETDVQALHLYLKSLHAKGA